MQRRTFLRGLLGGIAAGPSLTQSITQTLTDAIVPVAAPAVVPVAVAAPFDIRAMLIQNALRDIQDAEDEHFIAVVERKSAPVETSPAIDPDMSPHRIEVVKKLSRITTYDYARNTSSHRRKSPRFV